MAHLEINATEPQANYHAMTCKYPLFVGGYGSGKSEAMINQAIIDASHDANALIGLYEPTYDLVKLIAAPRLMEKLSNYGIRYTYNKSDYILSTHNSQFGDFILRTLDNPYRIIGYETFRAHIDELDTLNMEKASDVWNKVIARNRQRIGSNLNRVSVYTTPEGFRFCHKRWVVNANENYQLMRAPTRSNPYLPEDYVQALRDTYPEQLINAYLEGEFVNLTAGAVYPQYSRDAAHMAIELKPKEPIYVGMDFNVTAMAAAVFVKRDGGRQWIMFDEIVDAYDTPDVIEILNGRYPDNPITVYPDATGGRRDTRASPSDLALLEQAGYRLKYKRVNPAVRDRVLSVNQGFNKNKLFVDKIACPRAVACLEQQVYDRNGVPDKDAGFDHMNDAIGYLTAYEMPVRKPMIDVDVRFAA